jgi:hypothetical protein
MVTDIKSSMLQASMAHPKRKRKLHIILYNKAPGKGPPILLYLAIITPPAFAHSFNPSTSRNKSKVKKIFNRHPFFLRIARVKLAKLVSHRCQTCCISGLVHQGWSGGCTWPTGSQWRLVQLEERSSARCRSFEQHP